VQTVCKTGVDSEILWIREKHAFNNLRTSRRRTEFQLCYDESSSEYAVPRMHQMSLARRSPIGSGREQAHVRSERRTSPVAMQEDA
jgi:hypothetical protein